MPNPIRTPRKTGTVWLVKFREHGKGRTLTFDTKPEAQRFCDDIENRGVAWAVDQLMREEADLSAPTVREVARKFFDRKASRVMASTVYDYRKNFERRIEPTFGDRHITTVKTKDVQEWIEACIADGMQPKSIVNHHSLLSSIFDFAASPNGLDLDLENPCKYTELPKRAAKVARDLTVEDWAALRDGLIQTDRDGADLAEFLLASGFRWSEATALDGRNVGTKADGTMLVSMNNVMRRVTPGHFEIVRQAGKNDSSRRTIALSPRAAELVKARQAKMTDPNGLIFTTKTGAKWTYSNFYARIWRPALEIAHLLDRDPRPSPHALRHTHLTWLALSPDANILQVSGRAGHSNIGTTTNVYASGIRDVPAAALASMDGAIFGAEEIEPEHDIIEGELA